MVVIEVKDWLGAENQLGIDIVTKKYLKNETFDEFIGRISNGNEELKRIILEKKYLHGGRTLSNYNTGNGASTSNCYSSGYCPDDTAGILELNKNIGLTYKSQGGQGLSLSKIRPKGCKISKGGYETDGIIPFMQMFDTTTASISQGGSRKGALMMSLDCWHKEVKDFIKIKTDTDLITKANLSVEIDNAFMTDVVMYYDTGEEVERDITFNYDGGSTTYKVKPIEIYKLICETAHEYAEPGIIYTDAFRNYNLMEFDNDYQIVTGNPCGEQPLPQNGACNLGSINLAEFVKRPYSMAPEFDTEEFIKTTKIAIRALDDVLDYGAELHALPEQCEMAKNYRNIGLGIMGLGSMLFKMGLRYGSTESFALVNHIMYTMFRTAVQTSAELAKEKGTFPKYKDVVFDSTIIKKHFTAEEIEEMKKCGLRNCSLLSIAPSGSIGTLLNVTTGCEPAFRISYKRKTESLHKDTEVYYDVLIQEAQEYKKLYPDRELPSYFVASDNIHWSERIGMQAVLQEHVDTAISSTVNLPNNTTIDEVEQLYMYAWRMGLKGITVYRDGCARIGILTDDKTTKTEDAPAVKYNYITPTSRKTIGTTSGRTYCKKCACGTLYITINKDSNGNVVESFIHTSKGGICQANIGAINRMISVALRSGVKIDEIADQLRGVTCPACIKVSSKGEKLDGISCPDILGRTLMEFVNDTMPIEPYEALTEKYIEKCPDCGAPIHYSGGCVQCTSCAWSKCE